MKSSIDEIEKKAINTVRGLSMDAPHQAKSGHQGTAMALAPLAHVLWTRVMKYDPTDPDWPDRDRFILSAGHASILLYSFLHLTGYGLSLDDLRNFRQWDSPAPGHPEAGCTPGVEVTTGPLGQGFANGVGMAIAERFLREEFGEELFDHNIFSICGDGDLAEGISHEAASLAGHLGLGKLVYVYDDNRISIDGKTDLWLSDDPVKRFESYGWHVVELAEKSEDLTAMEAALLAGKKEKAAPTLVVLRSHIAFPSPDLVDSPAAHGYALMDEEIKNTKSEMGMTDEAFFVSPEVADYYRDAGQRSRGEKETWQKRFDSFLKSGDKKGQHLLSTLEGSPMNDWKQNLPKWSADEKIATRVASGECLKSASEAFGGIISGGADLTGNTGTKIDSPSISHSAPKGGPGRQLYYGVREHAMGGIMVGMALHGGVIPVGGTFLVFSDYMRPSVRLAALSNAKSIFVWTHDSVGVGEDGPTHQPIEHISSLRAIPELLVIRPADAVETIGAWEVALNHNGPTALILSRQNLPVLENSNSDAVKSGAYVIQEAEKPELVLAATGSELHICLEAIQEFPKVPIQVVSMPSWELLGQQSDKYKDSLFPPGVKSISLEAGTTLGWERWVDYPIGINRFGASAPGDEVMEKLGISKSALCKKIQKVLKIK